MGTEVPPTPDATKPETASDEPEATESLVGFRVGTSWLAVDVDVVVEVTDYSAPTPLPRSPPHIPGLLNLRGQALPLLDLGVYLDLDSETPGPRLGDEAERRRTLVVTATGMRVGLVCDRILGVRSFRTDEIQEVKLAQNRRLVEFARGEILTPQRTLVVLAMDKLLSSAQATG